jgi:hypothetical protein
VPRGFDPAPPGFEEKTGKQEIRALQAQLLAPYQWTAKAVHWLLTTLHGFLLDNTNNWQ